MKVSDYFAELFVAGRFADAGWNVYFPHRDKGFDFIATKSDGDGGQIVRPVQVKGKYPQQEKGDKVVYGYVGKLTQLHPEMVLAIPFFSVASPETPTCVAYLPLPLIKRHSRGYRCQPAAFSGGLARPRRDFARFFNAAGLSLVESPLWKNGCL
jgi:hypothetical protein